MVKIVSCNSNASDLRESRRSLIRWLALAVAGLSILGSLSWYRKVLEERIHLRLDDLAKAGYPIHSSQLNQATGRVPPEENAALKILEASGAISSEGPKAADLKSIERKSAFPLAPAMKSAFQQVSSNNAEAVALLDRAAELTQSDYMIDWSPGPNTLLPHLAGLKALASLARMKVTLALDEHDSAGAIQAIIDTLALGHSVAAEPCLVSQFVRISCVNTAAGELELMLNVCALSHEEIEKLRLRFREAESENQKGITLSLLGERCLGIGVFETPIQSALSLTADLKKSVSTIYPFLEFTGIHNRDFLAYLEIMDTWIKASELPFPDCLRETDRAAEEARIELAKHRFFIFSKLLLPALKNPVEKMAALEGRLRRANLALVIEDYRLQHEGHLPRGLRQLIPEHLPALPTDPFNGRPMRYEIMPQGFAVISAGLDAKAGPALPGNVNGTQKYHDVSFKVER